MPRVIDPARLPKHFDAPAAEARWDAEWVRRGVYTYDPARPRAETFVVDTPPPTVSGSLHVGHVFSYTHTDVIVRYQRCIALLLEFFDARFDRRLVYADHIVMLVHVDIERPANRHHQMFFIQLGVALDGIVLDVFGDVAEFRECLVFQFMVCISHLLPHLKFVCIERPANQGTIKSSKYPNQTVKEIK